MFSCRVVVCETYFLFSYLRVMIRLLVTGNFDVTYNRTAIILAGLAQLKNEVEVHVFSFKKHDKKTAQKLREYDQKVDVIFLPPFTHADVRFVKKQLQKPLFLSLIHI